MKTSPGERVGPQRLLHQRGQPVHALAEVDRLGREQDAHPRRDRDHASPRTASSTRRSAAASTSAPTRTTAGPSAISIRPAVPAGAARVLRDHHRHERGSLARRRGREPLPPDEELARVQPVAPRHRRDGARRVEALGHDPGLLLVGPAPAPADAGDHLEPAEAVVARTGRSTMSTHRSRARSCRLGPSSSSSSAGPQGAPQTTVTDALSRSEPRGA